MNRSDVEASRDLALRYVEACDELLAMKHEWHRGGETVLEPWRATWHIAGKATGAHRRLSLDLSRALSYMRRRS